MTNSQYSIYNDLEAADARFMLPSKVYQFPELQSDVTTASGDPQAHMLPECVGVDQVTLSSAKVLVSVTSMS